MNMNEIERRENIKKLENLAQEVLELKKMHRQRRPIVIEFCGSPKSGKTSSINSLNIFLKRNGFRTSILTERASVCPIPNKESPLFNVWTCSSTINEINVEISKANLAEDVGPDIIICDRGIFDALCWFRWLKSRNNMNEKEYNVLTEFAMLNLWQRNIDLVYVFIADPEESIRREYANLLTDKRGSIMREEILKEYRESVLETIEEYKRAFRATPEIDTTNLEQNEVGYIVTEKTLQTLRDMLMEKIGYIKIPEQPLKSGIVMYSEIEDLLEGIGYGLRDEVESNDELLQPIAVAVIMSKTKDKILCVKKTAKSTDQRSPESGKTLLYVGGHMRQEDQSHLCTNTLDVLRNTLQREILEELGISITVQGEDVPFVIYVPDSTKSRKHIAIGWTIYIDEETKFRLDSYEIVQRKGKSKSGTFISFEDIISPDIKLESWSREILLTLLGNKLSESQKIVLRDSNVSQLKMNI